MFASIKQRRLTAVRSCLGAAHSILIEASLRYNICRVALRVSISLAAPRANMILAGAFITASSKGESAESGQKVRARRSPLHNCFGEGEFADSVKRDRHVNLPDVDCIRFHRNSENFRVAFQWRHFRAISVNGGSQLLECCEFDSDCSSPATAFAVYARQVHVYAGKLADSGSKRRARQSPPVFVLSSNRAAVTC